LASRYNPCNPYNPYNPYNSHDENDDDDDDEDEEPEPPTTKLPFDSPHVWLDNNRGFSWSRYIEVTNSRSAPAKLFQVIKTSKILPKTLKNTQKHKKNFLF
jgi:hypothetical protein